VNISEAIQIYDTENYWQFLITFPEQFETGYKASFSKWNPPEKTITTVVIAGMGGSAIGGELIQSLFQNELPVPLVVVRNYTLPAFVSEQSLVIISSYSGCTEESLSAYKQALNIKASVICLTSGGTLQSYAQNDNAPIVILPNGYQPRAAVGASFTAIVHILEQYQLLKNKSSEIAETVSILRELNTHFSSDSLVVSKPYQLAQQLIDKIPIIYTGPYPFTAVGNRWKCQFNENAKIPAFSNSLPEMNHNEIMGWNKQFPFTPQFFAIFLRDKNEYSFPEGMDSQITRRIEITQEIIRSQNGNIAEVWSTGTSPMARAFSLLYFGDYTSYYLALLYKTNPTSINNIIFLKEQLKKCNCF